MNGKDRRVGDDADRGLRWRVIAAVVGVMVVLGLVGGLAGHVRAAHRPRVRLVAEEAARAASRPWDRGARAPWPPAVPAALPGGGEPGAGASLAPPAAAAPAVSASGADTGWRCVDDPARTASGTVDDSADPAPVAVQAAMRRELAALRASASAVDRAVAIIAAGSQAAVRSAASPGAVPGDTGDDAPSAVDAMADGLSRLALATNDATVYGYAVRSCRGARPGACAGIDAYRWARREPDNAVAWLYVAGEARAAVDPGAELDARAQMARAPRVDSGRSSLVRALVAHREPGDAGSEALLRLAAGVFGVTAAWPEPLDALLRTCRPEAARADANLAAWCTATAARFAARADTLDLSLVGETVQRRLDGRGRGPLPSLALMMQAAGRMARNWDGGCAGHRRVVDGLVAEGRLGERGALEAAIAAEGASAPAQ